MGHKIGLKAQLVLAIVGACGSGALLLLCHLCMKKAMFSRRSQKELETGLGFVDKVPKSRLVPMSKDQFHQVLEELNDSREQIKNVANTITQELLKAPSISFQQTYQRVKEMQPEDPLHRHNLSSADFDELLDRYQNDPAAQSFIKGMVGPAILTSHTSELTVEEIIAIHVFMLKALKDLTTQIGERADKDVKTMTIAAQCIVNAKVEAEFDLSPEDVETAVLNDYIELSGSIDFANVSLDIRNTMAKFVNKVC